MTVGNRDLVTRYYGLIWSEDFAAARQLIGSGYVEHQYSGGFSWEGVASYIAERRRRYPGHRVTIHQVLSDGNLVFVFAQEHLGNDADFARGDLYRVEDGLIVEHWNSQVLDEKNRKNTNGTFDGMAVNRDVDYARRFGGNFEHLDDRAFNRHDLGAFEISRIAAYKQHSPKGGDGLTGLVQVLTNAKARHLDFSAKRHHTLCDGDLLVSHRLYGCQPAAPLMNHHTFDIFRLNSEGRAVEHWDVMDDALPPAEEMAKLI